MVFQYCQLRNLSCDTDSVRTCGQGIDGNIRVFQQDIFGSSSILPNSSAYSQIGRLFSIADGITLPDTSVIYTFENPPTNNRTMYLVNVAGGIRRFQESVLLTMDVEIYKTTVLEVARELTPINRNLGSTVVSTLNVSEASDVEISTEYLSRTTHPSGEFSLDFYGNIIVPPGNTLAVEIRRIFETGSGSHFNTITWFEI
jgi:hypothetical protein